MKNSKNIFLSVILGGLVVVTAIAGIVTMSVKNNSGEELKETIVDESMEQYLWGSMEETEASVEKDYQALDAENAVRETESQGEVPAASQAAAQETKAAVQETEAVVLEETKPEALEEPAAAEAEPVAAPDVINLLFSEASSMKWPVEGNIVLGYSMDTTIYFSTLKQYKCNPGILIQSEPGQPVICPANAVVSEIGYNDEIGQYVVMSLGNGYEVICGQLDQITVCEGDYIEVGASIGTVAEPTPYYSVEGCNVYFELMKDDNPVDPLDFLE